MNVLVMSLARHVCTLMNLPLKASGSSPVKPMQLPLLGISWRLRKPISIRIIQIDVQLVRVKVKRLCMLVE